ncbi:unnamed protein product, partial [Rotaria socialis]
KAVRGLRCFLFGRKLMAVKQELDAHNSSSIQVKF